MSRQDQYGFYRVGHLKFYSKIEAIEVSCYSGLPVTWHFNDEIYSSYDWNVEPDLDIGEMYRVRAQQLREKYDYLVLLYSGGADSDNILDTFILNEIKLDEIVSIVNYEGSSDKFDKFNGEIFNIAIPKVDTIRNKHSYIKHRVIDITSLAVEFFSNKDVPFNWCYTMNSMFTPNHSARSELKNKIQDWKIMFDKGTKVGFIHGIEKPTLKVYQTVNGNQFKFNFIDSIDMAVTPKAQIIDRDYDHDELFYWSPESPAIVIKQLHILKKWIKFGNVKKHMLVDPFLMPGVRKSPIGACQIQLYMKNSSRKFFWVKPTEELNRMIYPTWQPNPFQCKSDSTIIYEKDRWFLQASDTEVSKLNWRNAVSNLWTKVPDQYKNDPLHIKSDIKWFSSKTYNLGG